MTKNNYNVLKSLCDNLSNYKSLEIPSPAYQKRRAAVAAIIRWNRDRTDIPITPATTLADFFNQDWVKNDTNGQAEILFMQRATRVGDRWSGHVSFIGGKNELDETDEETVTREVMEEIGLNLNNQEQYLKIGQVDQREISSVRDNKLLMILVPFVYLQIVPDSPPFKLQESEVAAVQWVPLNYFLSSKVELNYAPITEKLNLTRSKNVWISKLAQLFLGTIEFPAFYLPNDPTKMTLATNEKQLFRLWGLTLGITSDIVRLIDPRLEFLKLANKKHYKYSRLDIGFFTILVAKLRFAFGKSSQWDKVYFSSIKNAVILAAIFRTSIISVIIKVCYKKFINSRLVL